MEYNTLTFPVNPFPKPRMTQSDKWKKRPVVVKYHIFKDSLNHYADEFNYTVGEQLSVVFILKMPKSWSEKKKKEFDGQPHQQTPDLDNLVKAFKDALCLEDSYIHTYINMQKKWGREGKIIVNLN